jgi:hypothetical protein
VKCPGRALDEKSDQEKMLATVVLPQPHLVASKIDHDRSRLLNVEGKVYFASWRSTPDSLKASVWPSAERHVQELGQTPDHIAAARERAEYVLAKFFEGFGWKVEVKWVA